MSSGGAEPAAKKMRVEPPPGGWQPRRKPNLLGEWADVAAPPLRPAWLVKSALGLPAGHPSPAALQSCRVALQEVEGETLRAFIASGARVYVHELPMPAAAAPQRGKGGVLVPATAAGGVTCPLHALPARAEVQALDCAPLGAGDEALLAAVDAYGHVTLSRLRGVSAAAAGDADGTYLAAVAALAPRVDTVEPSWAGVSFAPGAHATLATARHLGKAVDVYDGDLHVRCIHTPSYPTAICFLPASEGAHGAGALVATTEACNVAIYDVRAPGGAAVRLAAPSPAALHCLAAAAPAAGSCMLAAAGADRTLLVFDVRKARPLRVLPALMRRDVTALRFCPLDARCVYAAGLDYEIQCRRWDAAAGDVARGAGGGFAAKHVAATAGFAFRGEARWAGLAAAGDLVAGYCASGVLYSGRVAPASAAEAEADAAALSPAGAGDDDA